MRTAQLDALCRIPGPGAGGSLRAHRYAVDIKGRAARGGLVVDISDVMPVVVANRSGVELVDGSSTVVRLHEEGAVVSLHDHIAAGRTAIHEHGAEVTAA